MDPLLVELGKQGIGFVLLAILGVAYLRKDRALAEAYQKRVEDNHKLATVIEATNAASKALESASENRSRVIEAVGEITRAGTEALKLQAAIIDQVRSTVEHNKATLVRLTTQLQHLQRSIDRAIERDDEARR